ncbi:MAG: hypothetical protein V1827_00325 [Candidatus Micrarchaeota archaeon]
MMYGIAVVILAGLLVVSIFTQGFGLVKAGTPETADNQTSDKLSDAILKSKLESYINDNLLDAGYTAEVTKLEPFDSNTLLASIDILQGTSVLQSAQAYITNDGKSMFLGTAIKLDEPLDDGSADPGTGTSTQTAEKVERPKAEAFVMSYCPYGLQFLKAYVPVMELLGDEADITVNFVDYAMHGKKEIDGNSYIYCVQKEEKAKLPAYLRCFLESGDYSACVATAGVDEAKLGTCITDLDAEFNLTGLYNDQSTWAGGQFPPYPVESALNTQYGVQGSPTFVLNGQQVSVGRSAEEIKQAICGSFITPPEECATALRSEQESAGLGPVGSGTSTGDASCG